MKKTVYCITAVLCLAFILRCAGQNAQEIAKSLGEKLTNDLSITGGVTLPGTPPVEHPGDITYPQIDTLTGPAFIEPGASAEVSVHAASTGTLMLSAGGVVTGSILYIGTVDKVAIQNVAKYIQVTGTIDPTTGKMKMQIQLLSDASLIGHSFIVKVGLFNVNGVGNYLDWSFTVGSEPADGGVDGGGQDASVPSGVFSILTPPDTNIIAVVGGSFSNVGGKPRNNFAAIDRSTGAAQDCTLDTDGMIKVMHLTQNGAYIGGSFSTIGGQPRNNIAEIIGGTCAVTSWNPNVNGTVNAIATPDNGVVAIGGAFTTVGGQPRANLAAVDPTTGAVRGCRADTDGEVKAMTFESSGPLYIGGSFSTVGGLPRNNIAAVLGGPGGGSCTVTSFNPNANGGVNAMLVDNNIGLISVGGAFTNIGGVARRYAAGLDITTGTPMSCDPNPDGIVTSIARSGDGSIYYVGGAFTNIYGVPRNHIAAEYGPNCKATNWNPGADGVVYTIAPNGNTVYIGGMFSNAGGQARNNIAAIDATTGAATAWNPDAH